ncbi:MAG: hypothetical protein MUF00_18790 [Gemmatimonadaceae bacterium]|jgi:hypothetical protein|nr:hypothetical protein [Gemmatimonadaceae bacterium]
MNVRSTALLLVVLTPATAIAQASAPRGNSNTITVSATGIPVPTNVTATFYSDDGSVRRGVTFASNAPRPVSLPANTYTVTADTVQIIDQAEGNVAYGPRITQAVAGGQPSRIDFAYVPLTGALRFEVVGLPAGVAAEVLAQHVVLGAGVRAQSGVSIKLEGVASANVGSEAPKRISMLLAGDWRVGARFVNAGRLCPTVPEQQVRVEGGRTTVVRFTYVPCRP